MIKPYIKQDWMPGLGIKNNRLYIILKNHRPDWDLDRTGTVVMGRTLDEAVDRALAVQKGLKE